MFFYAHSGIRYIVLVLAVGVVGYGIYGAATRRAYDKPMRRLASGFAGAMHLQILLGVALGLTGRFAPQVMGHVMMMLFAAAAAQIPVSVMRRRAPEERTYLPHVIWTLVALGIVYWGMAAIGKPLVG
jgi:hypothetical protein